MSDKIVQPYDSRADTLEHKVKINKLIGIIISDLLERAADHDISKLGIEEKELFDKYTPLLKTTAYNSDEYKQQLKELQPALTHHYAKSRHHPEHFPKGVKDMNLLDLLEMLVDWKTSTLRQRDGNMLKSIEMNKDRFGYSNELAEIFKNTAEYFDTLKI